MLSKDPHQKLTFPSWRRWLLVFAIAIFATSVLDTAAFNGEDSRWADITEPAILLIIMTAAFVRPHASKDFAFNVLRFLTGAMIGGMAGYFSTHLFWATVL